MSGGGTVFHCPGPNPAAEQDKEPSLPRVKVLLLSRERVALMESEERCPSSPATPMSVPAVAETKATDLCYRCTVIMTFLQMLGTAFRPLARHSHK